MAGTDARRGRRPRRPRNDVLRAVTPVAQDLAAEQGLVVWQVQFVTEAGQDVLRVAVDRRGGVTSEQIVELTESLSRRLDVDNVIPGDARYVLEVSSPGAERKLKHPEQFQTCVGRPARITFRTGRPPLEGEILDADDESVTLDGGEHGQVTVGYSEVSQARLTVPGA